MKFHRVTYGNIMAVTFLLSGLFSGLQALASETLLGLKNPSTRILVYEKKDMPKSGTMGWGATMFRVEPGPEVRIALVDGRLRSALKAGFTQKGFTFVEEAPDYLISYALAAGAEIEESEMNRVYGDFLVPPVGETNEVEDLTYKRGVLIVDIVERKTKKLMWRGAIQAEIDMTWPEKRKQERCDAAVGHLLRFFPHPQK